MSASVFNPLLVSDIRYNIASPVSIQSTRTKDFKPNPQAISSVKRNIFGTVDHEECKNFVEAELRKDLEDNIQFWGFDFVNEIPLHHDRFVWKAIDEKVVSRPQKRPPPNDGYDNTHLYAQPLNEDQSNEDDSQPSVKSLRIEKVKQSLITDFMRSRKTCSLHFQKLKKNVTPSPNRIGKRKLGNTTSKT